MNIRRIRNTIEFHKNRVSQSWNHRGNDGKRIQGILLGYWWFFRNKTLKTPKDVEVFGYRKFRCYPDSAHAQSYYFNGTEYDSWDQMKFIEAYLKPGDHFIDVGANVGLFSLLASSVIGTRGKIIAIEPVPLNIKRLEGNIRLNQLENVKIEKVAVSDEENKILMIDADVGSHMVYSIKNQEVVEVPCVTLDSIIQNEDKEFATTKIDVEGMELKVLKGSSAAIIQGKLPVILFEANGLNKRYGISEDQICQFLSQNNYLLGDYDADNKVFTVDNKRIKENNYAIKADRIDELEKRIKGIKIRSLFD